MKRRRLVTLAAIGVLGLGTAGAAVAGSGGVTGYPNRLATVDLAGYQLQAHYPLGADKGNTFLQTYTAHGVSAVATAGPYKGRHALPAKYIAMPVGHRQIMVAWYNSAAVLTDVYVMNFNTGTVSDVRPTPNPASLGTVKIVKIGSHQIP